MTVQGSMIGLVVRDMAASLAFYRRIGLEIPAVDDPDGNVALITAG